MWSQEEEHVWLFLKEGWKRISSLLGYGEQISFMLGSGQESRSEDRHDLLLILRVRH